jgi:hypothetical protein
MNRDLWNTVVGLSVILIAIFVILAYFNGWG